MGFSVKTAIQEIKVPLSVNVFNEDTGTTDTVNVIHIFRFPNTTVREKHQSMLVTVKGRKVRSAGTSQAHWWLWCQCIIRVEGYDDLVQDKEGQWKAVFNTDILRLHIESAVDGLLNYINADEGELEKKLEPLSVL